GGSHSRTGGSRDVRALGQTPVPAGKFRSASDGAAAALGDVDLAQAGGDGPGGAVADDRAVDGDHRGHEGGGGGDEGLGRLARLLGGEGALLDRQAGLAGAGEDRATGDA